MNAMWRILLYKYVILRKIYDKNSLVNYELIAYVLNNIVHNALYHK